MTRRILTRAAVIGLAVAWLTPCCIGGALATGPDRPRHYIANTKRDLGGPAAIGFDLVDVSSPDALRKLPETVKGIYWLGNGYNSNCHWRFDDTQIRKTVAQIKDEPRFSGVYYISDEPHPKHCPDAAERIAERTRLIHALDPKGKTFIIVLNASSAPDEFKQLKDASDYIGVDPYPCNVKNTARGCDYAALRRRIEQALSAGIERERIVPVFQAFGQTCTDKGGQQYYRLPTAEETENMLRIWDELVPPEIRPFDMTYTWTPNSSNSCPSLSSANGTTGPDLHSVYKGYISRLRGRLSTTGSSN